MALKIVTSVGVIIAHVSNSVEAVQLLRRLTADGIKCMTWNETKGDDDG